MHAGVCVMNACMIVNKQQLFIDFTDFFYLYYQQEHTLTVVIYWPLLAASDIPYTHACLGRARAHTHIHTQKYLETERSTSSSHRDRFVPSQFPGSSTDGLRKTLPSTTLRTRCLCIASLQSIQLLPICRVSLKRNQTPQNLSAKHQSPKALVEMTCPARRGTAGGPAQEGSRATASGSRS